MALTLRSPSCLDQLSLIEVIARQLPRGVRLAIKEHPAMIGALGAGAIIGLLKRNRNVVLVDPGQNNYDVMSSCQAVVSVNSKSGAEALLLSKPVFVLGDAFYRGYGLTTDLDAPGALRPLLRQALAAPVPVNEARRAAFFSAVWRESHLGELYVTAPENLDTFSQTLLTATGGIQ
jgi:capsule polysaccharide export protein KpsC/LpsZ